MGHARGPSDNTYNAFPPNYKSNREAFASPSCFAFPCVAQTEKANLEEKCLLLAQVRRKAAKLLRDTLGVFRVWCFLAMLFVSLPHDPIGGAVDLTTQWTWWSNWWRRAQALSVWLTNGAVRVAAQTISSSEKRDWCRPSVIEKKLV